MSLQTAAKEVECWSCKKSFDVGKPGISHSLEALGHRYHRECLKCTKCSKVLVGEVYELAPGKPACKECANSGTESKSAGPCKACSKPINGPHVKAWGFNWHNECTVCAHCKKAIKGADGFFDDDINKPVHLACLK